MTLFVALAGLGDGRVHGDPDETGLGEKAILVGSRGCIHPVLWSELLQRDAPGGADTVVQARPTGLGGYGALDCDLPVCVRRRLLCNR